MSEGNSWIIARVCALVTAGTVGGVTGHMGRKGGIQEVGDELHGTERLEQRLRCEVQTDDIDRCSAAEQASAEQPIDKG